MEITCMFQGTAKVSLERLLLEAIETKNTEVSSSGPYLNC